MKNADKPIYPCLMQRVGEQSYRANKPNDPREHNYPTEGLTKREYFAAMAMQGFISIYGGKIPSTEIAANSLQFADELLTALEK